MKKRLTRIYTRTGDQGSTGLSDGTRVDKDSARIACIGEIDELNALVGVTLAQPETGLVRGMLEAIQHQLFELGGELAIPASERLCDREIDWLEQQLDELNETLPPLEEFILPGGNPAAAAAHHARTVCRRAERSLWQLSRETMVNKASLKYLNRLSDLLFVVARTLARQHGGTEVFWQKQGRIPPANE